MAESNGGKGKMSHGSMNLCRMIRTEEKKKERKKEEGGDANSTNTNNERPSSLPFVTEGSCSLFSFSSLFYVGVWIELRALLALDSEAAHIFSSSSSLDLKLTEFELNFFSLEFEEWLLGLP
ncbi:hypothetical protein RJT34_04710 [Clitoria ternatea]|uniref:Uncharacterized protein n=1 Tax=Clitoria ternatea TaxID=43366 RepID=A0AAN9KN80_CLITE